MDSLEKKYVYDVYQKIAKHFDITRGYLWHRVRLFLNAIPKNAIIADVGCGNGKNTYDFPFYSMSIDLCPEFTKICSDRKLEALTANALILPIRSNVFDYTICIAMLHHISSPERRIEVIKELIRITKPGGQIFIQVWAYEQPLESKKKFSQQDNYIPWHTQWKYTDSSEEEIYLRYYHVFKERELEQLLEKCDNYEKSGIGPILWMWWVIIRF